MAVNQCFQGVFVFIDDFFVLINLQYVKIVALGQQNG